MSPSSAENILHGESVDFSLYPYLYAIVTLIISLAGTTPPCRLNVFVFCSYIILSLAGAAPPSLPAGREVGRVGTSSG